MLIDACPTGFEENNEYIIFNSGGGFNLSDLTIDYASGNNTIGNMNSNNDLNIDVDNEPTFPTPCMLIPGDLSIYSGGCNLVAVGAGDVIPPNAAVIFQVSSDPNQSVDLSVLCASGQTIYITRSDCDRTIGAFTNGGSGTRTTNFGFGAGCFESVTYDRSQLPGGNGAHFSPCDGGSYGNDGCNDVVDVSSCFPPCPSSETQNFTICADGPIISPPESLAPAAALFLGASSVSFHPTAMDAMNDTGEVVSYGGQTAMPVTLFARVEYPDGCVVVSTLVINFLQPDGNAGSDNTENTCASAVVDLLGSLGGGVTAGSFSDDNGSGVNLSNPSAVDFTGVPTGTYNFTYTTNDDPATPCPPDMATVTVNVTANPVANPPSANLEICYTITPPSFTSNLAQITNQISGGIALQFYLDAAGTQPIDPNDPADQAILIATQPSVIFANFTVGGCPSNIVAINVTTEETPMANGPQSLTVCNNGSGTGTFDLSSLDAAINGNTGISVDYFFDMAGNNQIINPTNFMSAGGTVFAIVNANGICPSAPVMVTLNLSDGPDVASMFTEPLCNGAATGSISLNINSGSGPFTFTWNPSNLNGQEDPENLTAGDYFVTISDAGNCETTLSFTLLEPALLTLSNCAETTAATGPGNADGSATVTVTGGTPFYTVNYTGPVSGSQTGNGPQIDLVNLLPGDYTVTSITDNAGCVAALNCTFTITAPVPCDLTLQCAQLAQASGPVNADGSATILYGNGLADYTISVAGPTNVTLTNQPGGFVDVNNLLPGNYTVTLTDSDNCMETCTFSISFANQVCELQVDPDTLIMPRCFEDSTGAIFIDTAGVVGPLDIQWSDGRNEDSLFLDSLQAGVYSVTVTDLGIPDCDTILTFTLVDNEEVTLGCSMGQSATDSVTADGSATFTINGGVGPYMLNITGPTDTMIFNAVGPVVTVDSLLPGVYFCSITDSLGCGGGTCMFIITVAEDCPLTVVQQITPISCSGAEDGMVDLMISGEGAPVDIVWSDPAFNGTTSAQFGFGIYSVTITDPSEPDCEVIIDGFFDEPAPLQIVCSSGDIASSPASMDGSGNVSFFGGTPPYTLDLTGPVNQTEIGQTGPTFEFTGLSAGNYTATITDANGCINACQFTVASQGCPLEVVVLSSNISCNGAMDGTITLQISNNNGSVNVDWDDDQFDGQQDLSNLPAGAYSAVITDAGGCSISVGPITIVEPMILDIECMVLSDVSNTNQMDGSAQGIVTGGTGPYQVILRRLIGTFSVNDTVTLAMADTVLRTNLVGNSPPQDYEFVVVDANGCRDTCAFSIFEPPCPNSFIAQEVTDVSCPGDSNGRIEVTVVNATPPLTYSWSPFLPDTNIIDNVSPGTYTLIVTDTFGCTTADLITVNEPSPGDAVLPGLSCMALMDESVPGAANGSGQLTITGERPPFTIDVIGPVASNQQVAATGTYDLMNLSEGTYSVVVTDSAGCATDTCMFTIDVGACDLDVIATVSPEDCAGPGEIALEVIGGTAPFTFDWDVDIFDGQDTISAFTDIYSVTVTDAAGCMAGTTNIIPVLDNAPDLTFAGDFSGCVGDSIAVTFMPTGGEPGYTYHYTTDPASSTNLATSLADTTIMLQLPSDPSNMFVITVDSIVDANGCSTSIGTSLNVIVNAPDTVMFGGLRCVGDTVTHEGMDFFAGNPSDTFLVMTGSSCGIVYQVDYEFESTSVDTLEQTLCPEDSLIVGTMVFNGNNLEGEVNFGNVGGGCDSVLYVRIDYLPIATGSFTTSACEGDTIFFEDDIYTVDNPVGSTVLEGQTANGCDSLVFVSVNFQPTARVELSGSESICLGDTVMLMFETANGGPFDVVVRDGDGNTYNFSGVTNGTGFPVSPENSTIFTLVDAVQGGPGCPINFFGNMEVQVSRLLGRLTVGGDFAGFQISCNGAADGSLIASVTEGIAPFTYLWNDSITNPVRNNLGPGNYSVTITDAAGCERVYSENLQEPPPLLADPMIIPPGCNETDGFLVLDTIRGGVGPYELTVDGTFFQAITRFPYRQELPPGDYVLQIRDVADCFRDFEIFIPEPADPELILLPESSIRMGDSILLSAQTNFNPDSIRWEPENLVSQVNALSTYGTPLETTRFFITVMDTTGCRATGNVLINVDENVPIYVPTGFSPNTDGANDLFQIYGDLGVDRVNVFRIYDRWGEMVYEALDYDITNTAIGWDGKHKGKTMNPQVLVYYVNASLVDGREVELKGDITLIR